MAARRPSGTRVRALRPHVSYNHHLVGLVAEVAVATGRLAAAEPACVSALAASARLARARLSARLDGSPLTDATADAVDAGIWDGTPAPPPAAGPGGWAQALRIAGLPTQDVAAVEYLNLLAAADAEASMAATLFEEPLATLGHLHGLLCAGLVDPEVIGRPRRTSQALADGAQGRVIYHAPDPETVPGLLAELQTWLAAPGAGGSADMPAVVVAAIVHERLLEWQPFEAANGRLARAATRLVLRARGVDSCGVAVLEQAFARDAMGYYAEVASTIRRRGDVSRWVERHTEALVASLRQAADAAVPPTATSAVTDAARAAIGSLGPGASQTVSDYARQHGWSRETAWGHLRALEAEGWLARQPGTKGMSYRRVDDPAGEVAKKDPSV